MQSSNNFKQVFKEIYQLHLLELITFMSEIAWKQLEKIFSHTEDVPKLKIETQ